MQQLWEKIQKYLYFIQGPSYLLFMSEAGRCEYLIFIAVHMAMVQALGMEKDLSMEAEVSEHVNKLALCYYDYFYGNKLSEQEKCRRENKILIAYLKEHLKVDDISPVKFRQWKKRALDKDPVGELDKIVRKVKRE